MTSPLITYETAVLAKEKGFAVPSNLYYDQEKKLCRTHKNLFVNNNHHSQSYSAPTQDLLQKWIRETHGWYVLAVPEGCNEKIGKENWVYILYDLPEESITKKFLANELGEDGDLFINAEKMEDPDWYLREFDTYELALEEGLLRGLNLIKG